MKTCPNCRAQLSEGVSRCWDCNRVEFLSPNVRDDPSGPKYQMIPPTPDPLLADPPRPLTAKEFEGFVARLICDLKICRIGDVQRNRRYPGKLQPGAYETDISIEFTLGGALAFLVIVECKNWQRPVDRPSIQKLINTRDAIGAQKAAIASPVGFTREAAKVAQANSVALWVVGCESMNVIGAGFSLMTALEMWREMRKALFLILKNFYGIPEGPTPAHEYLGGQHPKDTYRPLLYEWSRDVKCRDGVFIVDSFATLPAIGKYGVKDFNDAWIQVALQGEAQDLSKAIARWHEIIEEYLSRAGVSPDGQRVFVDSALRNDPDLILNWVGEARPSVSSQEIEALNALKKSTFTYLDAGY